MATVASSSSKGFHFTQPKSTLQFDELVSQIPYFYSASTVIDDNNINSSSSSGSNSNKLSKFRTPSSPSPPLDTTTATYLNDPELYMGDDCDTLYQDTLLNSNLLQLLTNDMDGFSKTNNMDVSIFCSSPEKRRAHQRLEMLLAHVNKSYSTKPDTIIIENSSSIDHKGKNVDR